MSTEIIECPCCQQKITLSIDWWNDQPTNVTECPICLSLIKIDISEMKAINLREYLKSNYKRFIAGASNKPFIVREPDMISYISAEDWPD